MDNQSKISNPFPGIRSFEPSESHLFFGREAHTSELIHLLNTHRFVAVLGSSGSGKSSLIKAGLIPSLMNNQNSKQQWKNIVFTPSDNPIWNLSEALAKENVENQNNNNNSETDRIMKIIRSGADGLTKYIDEQNTNNDTKWLIYIDQFEEIFRYISINEKTRAESFRFVNLIIESVAQKKTPLYIIISLRSEYLSNCTEFPGFPQLINLGHYLIPKLNAEELQTAIKGPIELFNASITQNLVTRILTDIENSSDNLPVLQHALMRTWEYWSKKTDRKNPLDIIHYEVIGTTKEALSLHAEEIFLDLKNQNQQNIVEKIFKALIFIGEDNSRKNNPMILSELAILTGVSEKELIEIIDIFRKDGRSFLMPQYYISLNSDSVIDITRESIIQIWKRLSKWIEEESKSVELYLRLSKSAELYQEGKTGLWSNPELQVALKWLEESKPTAAWAQRYDPYFERAISYLEYSKKEYFREIEVKENKQKQELKRARYFAIILGIASFISILFVIFALNLMFKAEASEKEAREKEKLAITESKLAEEKRKEAISQKKISEQQQQIAQQQKLITEEQKLFAIQKQEEALYEKQQAKISEEVAIKARDRANILQKEAERLKDSAINQKKRADLLRSRAEVSEAKTDTLLKLSIAKSLAIQATKLYQQIISGGSSKFTNEEKDLPRVLAIQAYHYNKMSVGNPNDPDLFNALAEISGEKKVFRGENAHTDAIRCLSIMNNNKTIVSCSDDGTVRLWDMQKADDKNYKPEILKTEGKGRNGFRSVALSSQNKYIAAGTYNGEILIWEQGTKNKPIIIYAHTGAINSIQFTNETTFISAGNDGFLFEHSLNGNTPVSKKINFISSKCVAISYNPKNNLLLAGWENGTIIGKKTGTDTTFTIQTVNKQIKAITVSNTGLIAVGGNSGIIEIWSLKFPGNPVKMFYSHTSGINSLSFNNNSTLLASGSYDGIVKIWNYPNTDLEPILLTDHDSWVYSLTFSPDGNILATGSEDKTIRFLSITPKLLRDKIRSTVNKNMNEENWLKYVGPGLPYSQELPTD